MAIQKSTYDLGVEWEDTAGYTQAVEVGDTIYISGQLGHTSDGKLVSPVPGGGRPVPQEAMRAQMTQAYRNAREVLEHFDCTFDNVVEEVVFAVDLEAALAVMRGVRAEFYGAGKPAVTDTAVATPALALPGQAVEIKFIARR